jgi:hypothetical protein
MNYMKAYAGGWPVGSTVGGLVDAKTGATAETLSPVVLDAIKEAAIK